jgi:scyllo-inositol 2-dehydrogenase (NADP+)
MRKVRVGIIGQGRSGHDIHVHTLGLLPDQYQVVAVCDLIAERCEDAAKEQGAAGYTDYHEMLKRDDLDLVINSTPSHLHVPVTMEIMDAGFNVLCEKPLARYASDVDRLIAKSKETGKVFAIFQQSRFAPYFQQVKKVIDSGVLGRIVMVKIAFNGFGRRWDWQTLQSFNGGNLLNTGPHPMDQALQLFGTDTMPQVTCVMDRVLTLGDAEDHVKVLLHGEGRPTIDMEISSCCTYPSDIYQVYGSQGGLTGGYNHMEWKYFKPEEAPERSLMRDPMPGRAYPSDKLEMYAESWDIPEEESNLFDTIGTRFYLHLYDTLVNGAPLVVTPEQVRQQIAVIEECHRQNPLSKLY